MTSANDFSFEPNSEYYWEKLRASPAVRELQAAFTCATGLPVCLLPARNGAQAGCGGELGVEGCMGGRSGHYCQQALLRAEEKAVSTTQAARFVCPAGLLKILIPVMIRGQHVANVVVGPFALKTLDGALFDRLVGRLERWDLGAQSHRLRSSWDHSSTITSERCQAVTRLACLFVDYLSECGNRLARQTEPEPERSPLLDTIEAMLADDPDAPLSLKRLAERVQMSPCHFCKTFKKQTGVTFAEYRTRLRVERAKKLLADARLKISAIAFDVGFNSVPYFNQAFRRVVGCSPSQYRTNLDAAG